jgi:hypothetical protein
VETAQGFGERLSLAGGTRLAFSQAQHLLLIGDGAERIKALVGHNRCWATYQPEENTLMCSEAVAGESSIWIPSILNTGTVSQGSR